MELKHIQSLEDFQKEVSSDASVLIKFEADWCSPCHAMSPIVEEAAKSNPDIKFVTVDIEGDGMEALLKQYSVRSVPTFIRLENGAISASASGSMCREEFRNFIKGL